MVGREGGDSETEQRLNMSHWRIVLSRAVARDMRGRRIGPREQRLVVAASRESGSVSHMAKLSLAISRQRPKLQLLPSRASKC